MKNNCLVRNYRPSDYETIAALYKNSSLYGGQFDEARDSQEKIEQFVSVKPDALLVAEIDGKIIGTVTLFEDGRSAWLYRFAVEKGSDEVVAALWKKAKEILARKGHTQVLVYAPTDNASFESRYTDLGFKKGNNFTAYWRNID